MELWSIGVNQIWGFSIADLSVVSGSSVGLKGSICSISPMGSNRKYRTYRTYKNRTTEEPQRYKPRRRALSYHITLSFYKDYNFDFHVLSS